MWSFFSSAKRLNLSPGFCRSLGLRCQRWGCETACRRWGFYMESMFHSSCHNIMRTFSKSHLLPASIFFHPKCQKPISTRITSLHPIFHPSIPTFGYIFDPKKDLCRISGGPTAPFGLGCWMIRRTRGSRFYQLVSDGQGTLLKRCQGRTFKKQQFHKGRHDRMKGPVSKTFTVDHVWYRYIYICQIWQEIMRLIPWFMENGSYCWYS